jgi:hypothetical protein
LIGGGGKIAAIHDDSIEGLFEQLEVRYVRSGHDHRQRAATSFY